MSGTVRFFVGTTSGSPSSGITSPSATAYRCATRALLGPTALKLWITSRTRSVLVKVTSAIFATGMPWGGQQHRLGPPPGHHRPGTPADNPQQPPALVVIDLADAYSFCHPDSLATPRHPDEHPNGASRQRGKRSLMRH
jgi:hypothetical protein